MKVTFNLQRRLMVTAHLWLIKKAGSIYLDARVAGISFDDMRGAGEWEAEEWI